MTSPTVDLRSDTVTRPTAAMRRAMAEAPVGDDVFAEDPTVNRLQERVAEVLGVEAALFVPSGTMANQIALVVHCRPGNEVLVGRGAHNWLFETGAAAAIAGVQVCVLEGDGRFDGAAVREHFKPDNHHFAPTRLLSVENTHNMGGGLVWERAALDEVVASARELGLATHLDGARIWNAAVATGSSERALCAGFDTISVCMSKGLGAPVGSLLCGSRALITEAHRARKMLGGGMRQAGIIAAGALHALEHHRDRLAADHDNARYLAEALAALPGLSIDLGRVHTNIVMIEVGPEAGTATELERRARERGVLSVALGARRLRLVTHLEIDRAAATRAAEVFAELCSAG